MGSYTAHSECRQTTPLDHCWHSQTEENHTVEYKVSHRQPNCQSVIILSLANKFTWNDYETKFNFYYINIYY